MGSLAKFFHILLLVLIKVVRRKPVIIYTVVALIAFFLSQPRPKYYNDSSMLQKQHAQNAASSRQPDKSTNLARTNQMIHYGISYVPEEEDDLSLIVKTANIMENAVVHMRGIPFFQRAAQNFGADRHEKIHLQIGVQNRRKAMTALGALIDVSSADEALAFARDLQRVMGSTVKSIRAVELTQDWQVVEVEWMDFITIITDRREKLDGNNHNQLVEGQHTVRILGQHQFKVLSTRVEATKVR